MNGFRFTLLADGSSDRVLIPILRWLLERHGLTAPIRPQWADLGRLRRPPQKLADRIALAVEIYPCDLLFIHRDAERQPLESRKAEILAALDDLQGLTLPAICVVPVRMQEAWLMIEEPAIRQAAGNRNGQMELSLPKIRDLEQISDPKSVLHELLRQASGLHGQRLRKLSVRQGASRLAELIQDFSPLLQLRAFQELDADVRRGSASFVRVRPDQ